jgi:hypothetical protein
MNTYTIDAQNWLVTADMFDKPPEARRDLVEDTFPLGSVILLASLGGIGKSMKLLDLALQVTAPDEQAEEAGDAGGHAVGSRRIYRRQRAEDGDDGDGQNHEPHPGAWPGGNLYGGRRPQGQLRAHLQNGQKFSGLAADGHSHYRCGRRLSTGAARRQERPHGIAAMA